MAGGGGAETRGEGATHAGAPASGYFLGPYSHLSSPSFRFAPQPLHGVWGDPHGSLRSHSPPPGGHPRPLPQSYPPTVGVDKVGYLGDSPGDRPPCKDSHVHPCRPLTPPPPAHTTVLGPLPHCPQILLFAQSTKASLSRPRGPSEVLQTGTWLLYSPDAQPWRNWGSPPREAVQCPPPPKQNLLSFLAQPPPLPHSWGLRFLLSLAGPVAVAGGSRASQSISRESWLLCRGGLGPPLAPERQVAG